MVHQERASKQHIRDVGSWLLIQSGGNAYRVPGARFDEAFGITSAGSRAGLYSDGIRVGDDRI